MSRVLVMSSPALRLAISRETISATVRALWELMVHWKRNCPWARAMGAGAGSVESSQGEVCQLLLR